MDNAAYNWRNPKIIGPPPDDYNSTRIMIDNSEKVM
jgi:hypothetical protein